MNEHQSFTTLIQSSSTADMRAWSTYMWEASLSWRYGFCNDCNSKRRREEDREKEEDEKEQEEEEEGGGVLHKPAVNGKLYSECQAER